MSLKLSSKLSASLSFHAVGKRFGGRRVLDCISWQVEPGEVVVLTGKNGAGKTTVLRLAAGLLEVDRGEVKVCGHSLRREPLAAKRNLGYLPDGMEGLPDLLVSEFLELVAALKGVPSEPARRAQLGVDELWGQRLVTLSFGQRKRVALAAALLGTPELLLLDEPSNGLDPAGVALVQAMIEERRAAGLSTLISTNNSAFLASLSCRQCHLEGGSLTES